MKIAIVHDFLNQYGGAEKCVEAFHDLYPDAPIYTTIYLPEQLPDCFRQMDIRTSFMQHLPFLKKHFKKYLLLYPKAIESFDLSGYEVILSSSSAFAKGIRKGQNTCHICYCYTPMRFVWKCEDYLEKENFKWVVRKAISVVTLYMKRWDLRSNDRVDYFVSISKFIQERIRYCYSRESDVIYPPVDVGRFGIADNVENYFLVVSRLNAYKRIDLVVAAFNRLKLPLRIVGGGPHRSVLERSAGSNIKFMGKLSEIDLVGQYSKCRALIFPGEEDFGIVPVEAHAAGRPVIAYAAGGALETNIDGVTGVFFKEKNAESLIDAVQRFVDMEKVFDSQTIRSKALNYEKRIFKETIRNYVEMKYCEYFSRCKL